MKCSFFTRSAKLRVSKLPLKGWKEDSSISSWQTIAQQTTNYYLRLLLLQILKITLQIVVRGGFRLQISINLANLFGDDVRNVAQRLLRRVLGQIPLEPGDVRGQLGYTRRGLRRAIKRKKAIEIH